MGTKTSNRDAYEIRTTTGVSRFDALAFAEAAAVFSAIVMIVLGVFGAIGVYEGAVEMMQQWHLFFEPTVIGTVAGAVEAAVIAFVLAFAFARLYNSLARQVSE